jgi:hypothetical protein
MGLFYAKFPTCNGQGRAIIYHMDNGYKIILIPIPMPDGYMYPLGTRRVDRLPNKIFTNFHLSTVHLVDKKVSYPN